MNKLSVTERAAIIRCLVEGNSIRATCRMTGAAKGTVTRLLVAVGKACDDYQDRVLRNLKPARIQADEIWCYVGSKAKNTSSEKRAEGCGDAWTWVALDADSKLAITWLVGDRDGEHAKVFMSDLAGRVVSRPQITTDALAAYRTAIAKAFGEEADYATAEKYYGSDPAIPEGRYSPAKCLGCRKKAESGNPDPKHVSTSHVERQNLTMRMNMRRFTRLTNGFSKKLDNLRAAVALHFMHYNFCRIHQTTRITPAMAAGVVDNVWEVEDMIGLLEGVAAK